jgi:LCP family protein required for cell wall assembly
VSGHEITIGDEGFWGSINKSLPHETPNAYDAEYLVPENNKDRLDILLMGIRGKDDPDGGNLTDTMLLLSYNKKSGKMAITSIPRDLYVYITPDLQDKLNSAYERLGVKGTKDLFSRITGVTIDNVVVADFSAFESLIDTLGGIDVHLDAPFEEKLQWGYPFSLPAGDNHLDSATALYYVRSRFSSSDFDRARRQQQVITAIRQKIIDTNFLTSPGKAISLLGILKGHIQTDINLLDVTSMISLANQLRAHSDHVTHAQLTTDNLLYDTKKDGAYILLPRGDNLSQLKIFFHDLVETPAATPSPSK